LPTQTTRTGGSAASSLYALNSEVPGGVLSIQGLFFVPFSLFGKKSPDKGLIKANFSFSVISE
jgi:hypothetical protein